MGVFLKYLTKQWEIEAPYILQTSRKLYAHFHLVPSLIDPKSKTCRWSLKRCWSILDNYVRSVDLLVLAYFIDKVWGWLGNCWSHILYFQIPNTLYGTVYTNLDISAILCQITMLFYKHQQQMLNMFHWLTYYSWSNICILLAPKAMFWTESAKSRVESRL